MRQQTKQNESWNLFCHSRLVFLECVKTTQLLYAIELTEKSIMTSTKRKIGYWLCLGVYLIGVLSYLTGLGAFAPTDTSADTQSEPYEVHMKETVAPVDAEPVLEQETETTILGAFSVLQFVEVVLGGLAMVLSTIVIREIETDRTFLNGA